MASTVTLQSPQFALGPELFRFGTFNLGVYATGGITISASQLKLRAIEYFQPQAFNGVVYVASGYAADKSTVTIKAYQNKNPADVGGADIPLPEVTNATDLTSATVGFMVFGH